MNKLFWISTFLVLFCKNNAVRVTESQLQAAGNVAKTYCTMKTSVSKELVDKTHQGDFADDAKLKCYLRCLLEKFTLMKDGKMDFEQCKARLNELPEKYVKPITKVIETCQKEPIIEDKCENAFAAAKCMYKTSPEFYILP